MSHLVYGNDGTRNGAEKAKMEASLYVFPLHIYEKTYSERKKESRIELQMSGCSMVNFVTNAFF